MEDLFSLDANIVAKACMEIHNNPEKFIKDKIEIVNRLLELPSAEVRDYPYHAVCAGSRGLRNFGLMALISLYRLNPKENYPSGLDIVRFYTHVGSLYFDSLFLVPKMREVLNSFLLEDLVSQYSEELFLTITQHIRYLLSRQREEQTELVLNYLKLIEKWYLESDLGLKVDRKWYILREIFRYGYSVVHKVVIDLLVKFMKKGYLEVISFYSYIVRYVGNLEERKFFEENLPSESQLPGINIFAKAETHYGKMEYDKAIEYYEQLPENFPFINIFKNYKLFWAGKYCFNHPVVCKAFKEFNKENNELIKFSSRTSLQSTLSRWKDENFDIYKQSSEFLLIEKGIQCKFCTKFISPNAHYCSKCGNPAKS